MPDDQVYRPCAKCGTAITFVRAPNGEMTPTEASGTPHWAISCDSARAGETQEDEFQGRTVRNVVAMLLGPGGHHRETPVMIFVDGVPHDIRSGEYSAKEDAYMFYLKPRTQ